eukprot:CAMPEP_0206159024 /NCGR_PEP_ID=MMETSP1474-20131121/5406_1 /ASSEMBLY_ACC=CAM_ASM_001110 /TAXON_ID=97495 /ORGANISM="Imantonia sp., Strain RCC918" /LENGTH=61 /DNA_ID=CAMNT_0053559453 /DNA_START=83 /DNA_END=264 /DNA_ORIENTATION=-
MACDCTGGRPAESVLIGPAARCAPARRAAGTWERTRLAAQQSRECMTSACAEPCSRPPSLP